MFHFSLLVTLVNITRLLGLANSISIDREEERWSTHVSPGNPRIRLLHLLKTNIETIIEIYLKLNLSSA